MKWPVIDVWRMSASRPWQLEKTHNNLVKHLKYSGELRYHLIESVLVPEYSEACIHFAKYNGYHIHEIKPAKGQGYAVHYALDNVLKNKYSLKMEDDFMPVMDIPLDDCILAMEQHKHINQICFNKRETMKYKYFTGPGGIKKEWPKKQKSFKIQLPDELISKKRKTKIKNTNLVVKEKWWFGSALWRNDFIKPIFKFWGSNTHNLFNDKVIIPMARENSQSDFRDSMGRIVPSPEDIERVIGCYIFGKTADPPMVEHTGKGDSIWTGEFQERMRKEGKSIIGN